jgi:hypothetical protein
MSFMKAIAIQCNECGLEVTAAIGFDGPAVPEPPPDIIAQEIMKTLNWQWGGGDYDLCPSCKLNQTKENGSGKEIDEGDGSGGNSGQEPTGERKVGETSGEG